MSELNKVAQEYLESLGVEVPRVEDAAPKTFDVSQTGRRNKAVPSPAPRRVAVPRALGAPYNLSQKPTPATKAIIDDHVQQGLWKYASEREEQSDKDAREMWDAINFQPLPIKAEEVLAPPAWQVWPTRNEVRVVFLVAVFVLCVVAFFATRTP